MPPPGRCYQSEKWWKITKMQEMIILPSLGKESGVRWGESGVKRGRGEGASKVGFLDVEVNQK